MDEKTLLALAKMFEIANEKMAEMNRQIQDVVKTLNKVKNPWPDYQEFNYGKKKRRLKSFELDKDQFNIIIGKPKDNANIQPNTTN